MGQGVQVLCELRKLERSEPLEGMAPTVLESSCRGQFWSMEPKGGTSTGVKEVGIGFCLMSLVSLCSKGGLS